MDKIIMAFFQEAINRIIPGLIFIGFYYNQEIKNAYYKYHDWYFFVVICILIASWLVGFVIDRGIWSLWSSFWKCPWLPQKISKLFSETKNDAELLELFYDARDYVRLWSVMCRAEVIMSRGLFLILLLTLKWPPNGYFAQQWHIYHFCWDFNYSYYSLLGIVGFGAVALLEFINVRKTPVKDPDSNGSGIVDLEVFYRVGVPDEERAQPQRLLLTVKMSFNFSAAEKTDSIADTIDYFAVSQRLLNFGAGRGWKLIEKLAADIAEMILSEFKPQSVTVEVKKFPIPQARHVSVTLTKKRN
jgi:FolB domain-containing protein